MTSGRAWPVLAASVIGIAMLLALGVWQVQRLQWKQAIIAEIEERGRAAPVTLGEAAKRADIDYLRVTATGRFRHDDERYMIAAMNGGPAFAVLTPLVTDDGYLILADRGLVDEALKNRAKRPETAAEPVTVIGQLRRHGGERGIFDPDNDEAGNAWYWWDVPALLGSIEAPANVNVLPFVLHVEPATGAPRWPRPQGLAVNLRNNHLGYALTWFGLAGALACVAGAFLWQRRSTAN